MAARYFVRYQVNIFRESNLSRRAAARASQRARGGRNRPGKKHPPSQLASGPPEPPAGAAGRGGAGENLPSTGAVYRETGGAYANGIGGGEPLAARGFHGGQSVRPPPVSPGEPRPPLPISTQRGPGGGVGPSNIKAGAKLARKRGRRRAGRHQKTGPRRGAAPEQIAGPGRAKASPSVGADGASCQGPRRGP
jgi:hypothetical protein